ncbi:hypothetical protein GCM10007094_07370 [Pseudovibrio japonicus]|uniref:Uncharacterized protein n=1 Tax=Pseudovibrio japonicus TaxID=366534 RepID=A0ABQ3DZX1_9HYPH|nr:hypothetical protein [Pseudovibrio japonicus]GHB21790.1 hypothetical protein GCM10007094_07370 [Pseudovibrio japonicus]
MTLNSLLLMHMIKQRRRAFSKQEQRNGEQDVPHELNMPHHDMPRAVISEENIIFGTAALDVNLDLIPGQLPSLYFMDGNGIFVRLRVLHPSGFAVFEADHASVFARVPGQFEQNLGNTGDAVRHSLMLLADGNAPVGIVDKKNNGVFVWYANEAAMSNPRNGQPLDERDEQGPPNGYHHNGHSIVHRNGIINYYDEHYPGFLDKLMLLGQHAQSYNVQVGDLIQNIPIRTNVEYFQRNEFATGADQRQAIVALVNSFV